MLFITFSRIPKFPKAISLKSKSWQLLEAIVVQLLIVYSVNVLLAVTAFSELAQFFQYVLQIIVDKSFPIGQFINEGFGVRYRVDRNGNGGGIMLFVREDISSKLFSVENSPTEAFFVEINLRKKKWLFSCFYNPSRENIENHLETLNKSLALYSSTYENPIIIGDFNICMEKISMSEFCDTFGLKSLIKDATCYKNPENSSSIDLILPNNPRSFQNSCVIKAGLSDSHRMVVTVMKTYFEKLKPRFINYRL